MRRSAWVIAVFVMLVAAGAQGAVGANPQAVSVQVGQSSDQVTVTVQHPFVEHAGTGTLDLRPLPSGVTTIPSPVTYAYQASPATGVAAVGGTSQTVFRFVAGPGVQPGTYEVIITDTTFQAGSAIVLLQITPKPPSFEATASPNPVTLTIGSGPVAVTVTTQAQPGFQTDAITYGFENLPGFVLPGPARAAAGLAFAPVTLQLALGPGAVPGRYAARLAGTVAGSPAKYFPFDVIIRPGGDLTVGFARSEITVCQNGPPAEDTLQLIPTGGYAGTPTLVWSGFPAGITLTPPQFAIGQLASPYAIGLGVSAGEVPPGTYVGTLTVSDPAAHIDRRATLRVTVSAADWSTTADPSALTLTPGGAPRKLLATVRAGGCFATQTVAVSVSGLPGGVSVTPAPGVLTAPNFGALELSFAAPASAPPGTYPLTVTFQPQPGAPKSQTVMLTIAAALLPTQTPTPAPTSTPTPTPTPTPWVMVSTPTPTPWAPPQFRHEGPRVDRVYPDSFEAGKSYDLQLYGVAFTPDTRFSLGENIEPIGIPIVTSPQTARARVSVLITASPGTRPVDARNSLGFNSGPGAVRVQYPTTQVTPTPRPKHKKPNPSGRIVLEAPGDPDTDKCRTAKGVVCAAPILNDETVFTWREVNPGLAEQFVLEIMDCDGKVLASAQTNHRYLRVTPALLASLPAIDVDGERRVAPCEIGKSLDMRTLLLSLKEPLPPFSPVALAALKGLPPSAAGHAKVFAPQPLMPGGKTGKLGTVMPDFLAVAGWRYAPGLVKWRVRGLRGEVWDDGTPAGETAEVERSDENGIIAPLPPEGILDCDKAPPQSHVTVQGKSKPGDKEAYPATCMQTATVCTGMLAALDGTIDLARSPFDPSPSQAWPAAHKTGGGGKDAASSPLEFKNVFVDWGDGSEPERLIVDLATAADQHHVKLMRPTAPPADRITHLYKLGSGDTPYRVRIYSLSDPDDVHPVTVSKVTLLAKAGRSPVLPGGAEAHAATGALTHAGAAASETAHTKVDLALLLKSSYLIACAPVSVVDLPGADAQGPLHLVSATIEFPPPYDKDPTPTVSDCAETLRPKVKITYWGHGKARISWLLDGVALADEELAIEPGVSKAEGIAGKLPYFAELTASLPTPVKGSPHSLSARIVSVPDPPAPSRGGGGLKGGTLLTAKHSFAHIGTILRAGDTLTPPSKLKAGVIEAVVGGAGGGASGRAEISDITAPTREYAVTAHSGPLPCKLIFPTPFGDFEISDLLNLVEKAGKYSGQGVIHLNFPSGIASLKPEFVPIAFSGWAIDTSGGAWKVTAGGADIAPNLRITPLGFEVWLKTVHLALSGVTLDGSVSLGKNLGLPIGSVKPPNWDFASVPVKPVGDFYYKSTTPVKIPLGMSGFGLSISEAVIDFSTTQGEAPKNPLCNPGGAGPAWTGIIVTGKLLAPDFSFGSAGKALPDIPFDHWAFGSGGFSAEYHENINKNISAAGIVGINIGQFDFVVCNSSFDAKVGVELTGVPLVEKKFSGFLQVTSDKGILAKFGGTAIHQDWKVVELNIGHAEFNYSSEIGDWAVSIDADAKLKLPNNWKVYEHQFAGFLATLDGKLRNPGGMGDWFPAGDTGHGSLGGFDVQVTKLGVGARPGGGVWFGISGEVTVASVLKATATDIKFKLDRSGGSYSMAGVDVGDLHLDFHYPDAQPTVHAVADISWEMEGSNFRFAGEGELSIIGSIDIKAGFLYGHDSYGSYWLAKAQLALGGPGIALPPTPLAIYGLGGGLAYGVPVSSFDMPLKDVKPSHDHNYVFSANVLIGTSDGGFTFWGDGRLTITTGGGAGVRLDIKAWVLTTDHSGTPQAEGCMQYAGGSFDAGFAVHFSTAGGVIAVTAPSGPDVCTTAAVNIHFGGDGWHVWLGTKANPVTVHILVVDAKGWFTVDTTGIGAGASTSVNKKYCVDFKICDACAWFRYDLLMEVQVWFDPFKVWGHYYAGVGGGVSVCGAGLGFDGDLDLTAQAPSPVQICGKVNLTIHTPNWFPNVHLHLGLCLP